MNGEWAHTKPFFDTSHLLFSFRLFVVSISFWHLIKWNSWLKSWSFDRCILNIKIRTKLNSISNRMIFIFITIIWSRLLINYWIAHFWILIGRRKKNRIFLSFVNCGANSHFFASFHENICFCHETLMIIPFHGLRFFLC